MANTAQARKRARQNTERRAHNVSQRSAMRTRVKTFLKCVASKDVAQAQEAYRAACSHLDRAARKGLTNANKAARLKRRMNARLRVLVQDA